MYSYSFIYINHKAQILSDKFKDKKIINTKQVIKNQIEDKLNQLDKIQNQLNKNQNQSDTQKTNKIINNSQSHNSDNKSIEYYSYMNRLWKPDETIIDINQTNYDNNNQTDNNQINIENNTFGDGNLRGDFSSTYCAFYII